jgi:hypothetical protein
MEDLLAALTVRRVLVLQRLLAADTTQAELSRWLARAEGLETLNPGVMPQVLGPLFALHLIFRERPRAAIKLVRPDEVRNLLLAANALAREAANIGHSAMGRASRDASRTAHALKPADDRARAERRFDDAP